MRIKGSNRAIGSKYIVTTDFNPLDVTRLTVRVP